MNIIFSDDKKAKKALKLVKELQLKFVDKLNTLSKVDFEEVFWQREKGKFGGGSRYEARDFEFFNTASVNVSQVHYPNKDKRLKSATAISTIIHPNNPNLPSMHMHISYTQLKDEKSYYRIMADLNPSIEYDEDKKYFEKALKEISNDKYDEAKEQGDKYFFIPALNRHRGSSHFYLENYYTNNKKLDYEFATEFGKKVIDTYIEILSKAKDKRITISNEDKQMQLNYHTLYLFQVLTLDRGTTAGLLVHNENDEGIMGSLPRFIDKNLLLSWKEKVIKPQDELVQNLVNNIKDDAQIDINTKIKLANCVREHYKKNKEALTLQASSDKKVYTVQNHK
ncbi:coproporphyrinogen III oxidase [Malaciobacter molluscorum LMG 25693]|uniref:coproporphyrinogen oxidase n=1 Tax=Malaciobacter molluscorum LMG 25693 TaxID=870501 RepID=A0A2G1DLM5_9BACT|nr:coproporphyrinogen III oxidase [Malaciobacter molluscorum]AXX92173.1 coproporphyrinogen III oxidase [Malaciobacter molluscorum LMG 25693]PHO19402.1 coproporphyrinogen III oxidase [Malaciobacter molluscorum LMG 25693]